jgi:hypothetical protein
MSEDWDKLADAFASHPIALIAKVDCTSDGGQPICQDFDIQVCHSFKRSFSDLGMKCIDQSFLRIRCLYWNFKHSMVHPGVSNFGLWRSNECRNL